MMKRRSSPPDGGCPCGTGRPLSACCGPFLDGNGVPPTAEALMRSRYSAYVLGREDYLLETWHPSTRPEQLVLSAEPPVTWLGLKVLAASGGGRRDDRATVEFVARYKRGGRATRLHERSRFERLDGRWLYVDGERP